MRSFCLSVKSTQLPKYSFASPNSGLSRIPRRKVRGRSLKEVPRLPGFSPAPRASSPVCAGVARGGPQAYSNRQPRCKPTLQNASVAASRQSRQTIRSLGGRPSPRNLLINDISRALSILEPVSPSFLIKCSWPLSLFRVDTCLATLIYFSADTSERLATII